MSDNIDTVAFMETLIEGDFPEKQAKALAKAMYQLIESQLVTKSYLDMRLTEFRAELKVEMAQMKAELIQWMVTLFFVQIGVMAGLLKLLH